MFNDLPLESLFYPAQTDSQKLIIVLHGRGDSAEGFSFLPDALAFEDVNYLLLNAPIEYFGGFSWYDLPPNQLPGIEYSRHVLGQTLDMVFSKGFDPAQTILFGFSQGSLLTFEFGARYKHVLAGYIGVSGYIYDASLILEEMNPEVNKGNWLCTHGYEDDVLSFSVSDSQVKTLQAGGFEIDFRAYHKVHTIDMDELREIRQWMGERLFKD